MELQKRKNATGNSKKHIIEYWHFSNSDNLPFKSSGVTITTNLTALSFLNISYDHLLMDLIHLTAAIPLFAIKT